MALSFRLGPNATRAAAVRGVVVDLAAPARRGRGRLPIRRSSTSLAIRCDFINYGDVDEEPGGKLDVCHICRYSHESGHGIRLKKTQKTQEVEIA